MKITAIFVLVIAFFGCSKQQQEPLLEIPNNPEDTIANQPAIPDTAFNLDPSEAPRFVTHNYIEIDSTGKISMFRSGIGHDYSDDFESCMSMKHYFMPKAADWSTVKIYSPVKGTVTNIFAEWAGSQIHIRSAQYPAFTFKIFHVNLDASIKIGDTLQAGELIGKHISNQTMSDIAVAVHTSLDGPKDNSNSEQGLRLISFFQVMTDSLLNTYGPRSREDFQISTSARAGDPLSCNGESFESSGNLENWLTLE